MAKFVYKMQNILELKYKLEEQAKSEYSQAMSELREEEKKLDTLNVRKNEYQAGLKEARSGKLILGEIRRYEQSIYTMEIMIENQVETIEHCKQLVEHRREKLNEVMMERKMHEKMKEKQFELFLAELNEAEKKEIDELVSFQYNKPADSREEF